MQPGSQSIKSTLDTTEGEDKLEGVGPAEQRTINYIFAHDSDTLTKT